MQPDMLVLRINDDDPSLDLSRLACDLHAISNASPAWDLKGITLCLDDYEYTDSIPSPELFALFQSIGSIRSLVYLTIYDSSREGILPISVISSMLQQQSMHLEHLVVRGLTLCGTSKELDEFDVAVRSNLTQLKHFEFTKLSSVVCTDILQRDGMEALFHTMAVLPNIQTIHGDMHWFLDGVSRREYSRVLTAVAMKATSSPNNHHKSKKDQLSLTLEVELGVDGETLEALVWENGIVEMSLVDGSIHGSTNPLQYLMLLAQIVELNYPDSLEKVILDLEGLEPSTSLDEFWGYLAQMLAHCTQTKKILVSPPPSLVVEVYLPASYQFQMDAIRAFADLLQNNYCLQVKFLRRRDSSSPNAKTSLDVSFEMNSAMHNQIDTFLCLNRNQRGYLMEH
jgi:hypothetical protein